MTAPFKFNPRNKNEWLSQVSKDLKGKFVEDLAWKISEDLRFGAIYSPEDLEDEVYFPIRKNHSSWEIGQQVDVVDPVITNRRSLEMLNGGVNALLYNFTSPLESDLSLIHI